MKHHFKLLLTSVLTTICLHTALAQSDPQLKVVRGKSDTVHTPVHFIIGVAKPGSQILINEQPVKQYSTGSFGIEMNLIEGDNRVLIKSVYDNKTESEDFSVFYKKPEPADRGEIITDFQGLVIKTLKGAYLNYGAGEDRLGGAKINFLPEGIKMEVIDSINNLYKVRLSENRYSYIPKQFTEKMAIGVKPPFSLSGSWSVSNNGTFDRVRVSLQERQPFVVYRDINPNRIIVDLHGVACNSNWITQYQDLEAIEYVHLNQTSSDVLSIIIQLKDKYSWGYSVDYAGNSLDIIVRHTPATLKTRARSPLQGLFFGIDAGHGGANLGAVSPSGIREKDLNLAMAHMLREELEKRGARVIMSRYEDIEMSMQERVDLFKNANVDMVVSVHCNAGGHPLRTMGTSTYYRHIDHRALADVVLRRLLDLDVRNFGLIGNFNFALNAPTDFPSVLVETLFMSSLPEEEMLADEKFQKEMMLKVAKGLEDYIKLVRAEVR